MQASVDHRGRMTKRNAYKLYVIAVSANELVVS